MPGSQRTSGRRRVAYYLSTSGYGGVENYLLKLLEHLDRSRWDPMVYFHCAHPTDKVRMRDAFARMDVLVRELDDEGLPVSPACKQAMAAQRGSASSARGTMSMRHLAKRAVLAMTPCGVKVAWYHWKRARQAAAVFQRDRLDVIHFMRNCYPAMGLPVIASALAGIPIRISGVRGEPGFLDALKPMKRLIATVSAWSTTHIVAMSQRMVQQLIERCHVPRRKIHVIYNGINVSKFSAVDGRLAFRAQLGVSKDDRVLVAVSRLSKEKGLQVLLEAIALTNGQHGSALYLFAGDGPQRKELEQLAAERNVQDRVRFLGFSPDVPTVLAGSDALVLPSLTEGVPAAVLEAMATGKPVIATDVGGMSEIMVAGETGWLVKPGDPNELARALSEWLSTDSQRLRAMGERARVRAHRLYTQERMLKEIYALYDGAAPSRSR